MNKFKLGDRVIYRDRIVFIYGTIDMILIDNQSNDTMFYLKDIVSVGKGFYFISGPIYLDGFKLYKPCKCPKYLKTI